MSVLILHPLHSNGQYSTDVVSGDLNRDIVLCVKNGSHKLVSDTDVSEAGISDEDLLN